MIDLETLIVPTKRELDLEKLRLDYVEGLLECMNPEDLYETFRSCMIEHLRTLTEEELYNEMEKWGFEHLFEQKEIIEC